MLRSRPRQATVNSAQHIFDGQSRSHVELRGEAHLDVAHPFIDVVPRQLVGHALQGLNVLEDGTGVLKPVQILHQARVALLEDELRHARLRLAGQVHAPTPRKLDQGAQPHGAIEVDVEVCLGQSPEQVDG